MLLARERPPEILTIDENHSEVGRGVFGLSRERPRRYPFRVAVGRDHIDLSIGRLADGLGSPPEVPSYVGDERLEVVRIYSLESAPKVVFRRCRIFDAVRGGVGIGGGVSRHPSLLSNAGAVVEYQPNDPDGRSNAGIGSEPSFSSGADEPASAPCGRRRRYRRREVAGGVGVRCQA